MERKRAYEIGPALIAKVRQKLQEPGMNPPELASRWGVSATTIRDVERGRRSDGRPVVLTPDMLRCLANGIGATLDDLIKLCKTPSGATAAGSVREEVAGKPGGKIHRLIEIAILLNGDVHYSDEIGRGFEERVEHLFRESRFRARIEHARVSPTLSRNGENVERLTELLCRFPGDRPEFLVTIGTQPTVTAASVARSRDIPLIFIGVTDPVSVRVVRSLDRDPGRGRIAGTTYDQSTEHQLRFLSTAFQDKRIGFVWSRAHPQDVTVKAEIQRLCESGKFDARQFPLVETSRMHLTPREQATADIFFGFFHLNANFASFCRSTSKPIVGVNVGDVRRGAIASTGHDDRMVGAIAAEQILFRHLAHHVALCDMEIIQPSTARFALNLAAAKQKGITIDQAAVDEAWEIIDR